jgi:hypothetical protein
VFDGSLESGGWFCVAAFGRNLTSVAVNVFTFNLLENKFYILHFQCDFQR